MDELFIYGDPRFLSHGHARSETTRESYERAPLLADLSRSQTTESLECMRKKSPTMADAFSSELLQHCNQAIHAGKSSYHSSIRYNSFLVDGQWPSAGVELETVASRCNSAHAEKLKRDLWSNWFHFERDGSLDNEHSGEYGFELITEPLPPKVYRDPATWVGLENILSPWLESFDHDCTGLHVHVGLNQFKDFDSIPLENLTSRMFVGKAMSLLTYFTLADAAFIDRVCLRKQTRYCGAPRDSILFSGTKDLPGGTMTGYEFIDLVVSKLLQLSKPTWNSLVADATSSLNSAMSSSITGALTPKLCQMTFSGTTSHGTEVNTEHMYTIEFRRGKGTIHALSIHRMVELMTSIVRYAGKCCRHPEEKVSKKGFYEFVHDNTTSTPLRLLVEKFGVTSK